MGISQYSDASPSAAQPLALVAWLRTRHQTQLSHALWAFQDLNTLAGLDVTVDFRVFARFDMQADGQGWL